MSIEPEVPYNIRDNYNEEDADDWRDPDMQSANAIQAQRSRISTRINRLVDVDVEYAPSEISSTSTAVSYQTGTNITPANNNPNAGDHWVLPTTIQPRDLLGPNMSRITDIQKATGSYIKYNSNYNQVDIWGSEEAIEKAKNYLDTIVATLMENDPRTKRKTKKWSKPERELTEKEKRRAERRQAKMEEKKRFQGLPTVPQSFNGVFPLPDNHLPLARLSGENDAYLNQIRADCKAFVWYDHQGNKFRIASDTEEAVKLASQRIRNWYLRCCRKPIGETLRLVQQPRNAWKLTYRDLPSNFVTFEYADPQRTEMMLEKQRLIDISTTGVMTRITNPDLIQLTDSNQEQVSCDLPDVIQDLNERNKDRIETALTYGLESIRLNDWLIRMKIRFGTICLIDYPKKKNKPMFNIEDMSENMFLKPQFKSALATCVSKNREGLQDLFDFLDEDTDAVEFSDNPQTSFSIHAKQYPSAAPPRIPGQRDPPRGDKWDTIMQIAFTSTGQRRLWSTMTDNVDLVDISTLDIESKYSYDLKLQYARLLPNDDVNLPHEKFSHHLRVSPTNRLVLIASEDYTPQLVTQKTKWKYQWKQGYVIEVCRDEMWDMNRIQVADSKLPLDLSHIEPHRALFKVSLYKEAWVDRFAENLILQIGEAPSWNLKHFLVNQEEQENVETIMTIAKEFSDLLNAKVPLYWDNAVNSLV